MSNASPWSRIRKARLGRVVIIYAGVSWMVLEATGFFIDNFGLAPSLLRVELVLLAVGLVVITATAIVQASRRGERDDAEHPTPWEVDLGDLTESVRGGHLPRLTWARALLGGLLAFALVFLGAWLNAMFGGRSSGMEEHDPQLVAVVPFRVTGGDPSLAYLGEGMMDLLAAKLSGDVNPRAVDPRLVLDAWRSMKGAESAAPTRWEALELARSLGAGYALVGWVVGTPVGLVLNAELLSGETQVQADVEGPADSLTSLVDRLAARLLLREAGEQGERLATLTSTSLPALHAYLNGQVEYRNGRYGEAVRYFELALEEDSTFALAGLGLASSAYWAVGLGGTWSEGLVRAWEHRERLSARDRGLLMAWLGPRFPAPPTWAQRLQGWEQAIEAMPGRPEAWYEAGDVLFHYGAVLDVESPRQRARAYFERTVELDSTFVAPLGHLVELAALTGDTAAVRDLGDRYFALDSVGGTADYLRWRVACALEDGARINELRERFQQMSALSLRRILRSAQRDLLELGAIDEAAAALEGKTETRRAHWGSLTELHDAVANAGRPSEALRITVSQVDLQPAPRMHLRTRVRDALYWDGDREAGAAAVRELAAFADAPLASDPEERNAQFEDICIVEQWRLWNGELSHAESATRRLLSAQTPADSDTTVVYNQECAVLLQALLANAEDRPDADAALSRLESLARAGPASLFNTAYVNLVLARLLEARGDRVGALAAVRRLGYPSAPFLSSYLREEGRLAALIGDREGAIRAYRHYLALRADPEPVLAADVEAVRAELERLVAEDADLDR
jgi:tetratricopeptide (TPR) repeat protein